MNPIDRLARVLGRALGWIFPVVMAFIVWEVFTRYALNDPTFWTFETTITLAALAFIFGGAYCMADDAHMRITVVTERLGPRAGRVLEILSTLVGIVYLAGLSYAAWGMTERSLLRFSAEGAWDPVRSGSAWNPPTPSFINAALCLGAVLFLAVLLARLVRLVRGGPWTS